MKKVFAVFTVLLCLMLCVAPALAYEYLLEASTKATPIMYQNLLSEDEENSRYYFYVGVDGLSGEAPDWASASDVEIAYAMIRQKIRKELGNGVEIVGFNFDALYSNEKVSTPQENPEDFSFDWRPYPDGFENGSSTTYNAYVPYDMFGASAGDQIWVYTARFDYESDEGWVVERVNSEKTKDYLITKHEHLTPVVFAWKPANTMLPDTGDESHVILYAALLMLSSVVLVHWVRRRVF